MFTARTPNDVLHRYKRILRIYKKGGSMAKAFNTIGIDRNTVALTAPLAEIMIAAPEFYKSLTAFDSSQDTLLEFVKKTVKKLQGNAKEKI